jgi:hypothetical protein
MSLLMPNDIGPVRQFKNRKTGQRFLAAEEPNQDVIYAELDEKDNPINAGNRFPKAEFNRMLDDLEMEADHNTVGFTFFGGQFIRRQQQDRM